MLGRHYERSMAVPAIDPIAYNYLILLEKLAHLNGETSNELFEVLEGWNAELSRLKVDLSELAL